MAITNKVKTARSAKITGFAADTTENILAYLSALESDMLTGNAAAVIVKCNSRTRAQDVADLLGRALKSGEGRELLTNASNMEPGTLARANATAELLQDLRKTTRTNCRFQTFAGPLAMIAGVKKEISKNTRIVKKLG